MIKAVSIVLATPQHCSFALFSLSQTRGFVLANQSHVAEPRQQHQHVRYTIVTPSSLLSFAALLCFCFCRVFLFPLLTHPQFVAPRNEDQGICDYRYRHLLWYLRFLCPNLQYTMQIADKAAMRAV